MKPNGLLKLGLSISMALLFMSCQKEDITGKNPVDLSANDALVLASKQSSVPTVSVFATGLNNPRGLKFGPDGNLYVAEGGKGGTNTTTCTQVIPPIGPYTGSMTGGRISKINKNGVRSTVVDDLPSSNNALGEVSGASDVAFVGGNLYVLISGGGCSHGVANFPNGIYRINKNGTHTMIANLSNWSLTHPVLHPEEDDYEPDGDWYSMVYVNGGFYAVEANHGEMVRVKMNGNITRVVDISATYDHIVPTAVAFDDNFYIGNLNPFPIIDGSSSIYRVKQNGSISVAFTGFTTILGLVLDDDNIYVLQSSTGHPFPTPGFGNVIKIDKKGKKQTIATGLNLPTAITMGCDGNLYVSNWGYGPPAIGGGQVVKITLPNKGGDDHGHDDGHHEDGHH